MISIGLDLGGPEYKTSTIKSQVMRAMNVAARHRRPDYDAGAEAWMNPVFVVPGSIRGPDFLGLRAGHFSRKVKGLVIEIAVPLPIATTDNPSGFIVEALRQAKLLAAAFFIEKGISFPVAAEKIILAIEADLSLVW